MKRQLIHALAGTVLGLGLTTGIAAAQTAPTISDTGMGSKNIVKTEWSTYTHVYTYNGLTVGNSNQQGSSTGNATVKYNQFGGSASTGAATNNNTMSANVGVNNSPVTTAALSGSSSVSPSIDGTGNGSINVLKTESENKTHVATINDLSVTNDSTQLSNSGNATVKFNMYGGSATTGSASNTNNSTVTLNVTN